MKHRFLLVIFLFLTLYNTHSEETKIYLANIGPGDPIFLRWGHFAIIVDYPTKRDLLFDYGNFSFEEDNFVPNFIKGVMVYLKLKKSADFELAGYVDENRDVTLYQLNLSKAQLINYERMLFNEITPENRYYQYDHYYNNCVSQMANFIDTLSDGAFYNGTTTLTGKSFRDLSRDYVSSNFFYNTFIMFLLGPKVDHIVTQKEAMFLPDYTVKRATEVYISDDHGGYKPLISDIIQYNKSIDREPVIVGSKPKTLRNFFIGLILALLSILISRFYTLNTILQIITGLFFSICGSILFFMSFFTEHYYIHNNWNLIMVNPLTITLFISGIIKLRNRDRVIGESITYWFVDITVILIAIMICLKAVGIVTQVNGEIISLITPLFLVNSSIKLLLKD